MKRAHIFNAGPGILPVPVLEETKDAVLDYMGLGLSIMEMSHRSKEYDTVIKEAQADCLKIMGLSPADYTVLFLGGGASLQFHMVPVNFLKNKASYINTGTWATNAIKEAKFVGETIVVASSEDSKFNFIPKGFKVDQDSDYFHYTTNNTIYGTEWKNVPEVGNVPLVADMSSDLFSRELPFDRFSLIYGGAQKNIGPAGVTMVVIKKEFLEKANTHVATMLKYKTHADKDSLYNTPPCLPIYVVHRVFKWILNQGGIPAVQAVNEKKAGLIYNTIDGSDGFYRGAVANKEDRSLMNITFNLLTPELEAKFIDEAKKLNMIGLKGHRSVGGVRASTYNACPVESCEALAKFMEEFRKANK